jgi:uracil-DNA glycosylase
MPHPPRPVVQIGATARIVVIGQAPGARVHESGIPWNDASGERLREWTAIPRQTFYDAAKIVLMPMGFCYPGAGKSGDLPPRPECAQLWHERVLALLPPDRLLLLVGSYAQRRYLTGGRKSSMTDNVREQPGLGAGLFALPHPSWRSSIWMARNPWFETETLPALRREIRRWLAPAG